MGNPENIIVDNADQLSVLTHELRTPLNGLLALTDVLGSTSLDNNQKRIVDELGVSAKTLHRMIEQMLDYSKLRVNDQESIIQESFSLRETITRITVTLFERAKNKDVDFKIICKEKIPDYIIGDESAIEHILFNIIGNCITYTDTGHVVLFVSFENDHKNGYQLQFHVIDSGIGMAPEFVKRIFLPFVQEKDNPQNTKKRGGVGLGMAITQHYINKLNGAIKITSELGVGSEFTITLPIKVNSINKTCSNDINVNVLNNPSLSRQLRQALLNRNFNEIFNVIDKRDITDISFEANSLDIISHTNEPINNFFNNEVIYRKYAAVINTKNDGITIKDQDILSLPYRCVSLLDDSNVESLVDYLVSFSTVSVSLDVIDDIISDKTIIRRALIAEDDPVSQLALKLKLEDFDFMADVVTNGQDALQKLKERRYDLVVLDVQMPKLDGIGVLKNYDRSVNDSNTRFVMLSADGSDDTVSACKELGIDIFFTKPISENFTSDISKLFNLSKTTSDIEDADTLHSDISNSLLIYKFPADIFNLDNLLISLNNSHEYTKNIILLFIETSAISVDQLKVHVKSKDSMMCCHYAHKLRSSAQQACIHMFEDDLFTIEFSDNDNKTIAVTKEFIKTYHQIIARINLVLTNIEWL
jgi:two-component system sensor histidine kinase RpfC